MDRSEIQEKILKEEPWCSFIETRRMRLTKADYLYRLTTFRIWMENNGIALETVSRKNLIDYTNGLKATNQTASVLHHMYVIRSFWTYMNAIGYTQENPTRVFDALRMQRLKFKPRPIDEKHVEALVKNLRYSTVFESTASCVVLLGLFEGLRIGEIAALKWRGIDWENNRITLIGKGNLERTLPMHASVRAALWNRRAKVTDMFGQTFGEYIFRTSRFFDGPASRGAIARQFCNAKRWAGLQGESFTPHSMRHTFASRLAAAGTSPYEIMKLLGHSSIQMSMSYIHTSEQDVEKSYRSVFV